MEDHLQRRREGDLEGDLRANYHPDVVVLSARELFRGHDGVRASAGRLEDAIGDDGNYTYDYVLADDRMGMLEWRAESPRYRITCAVDSYLIEDGLIKAQTIHYRVRSRELSVSWDATL